MSYSFSQPIAYNPQQQVQYYGTNNNYEAEPFSQTTEYHNSTPSSIPAGVGGAVIGATIGGISGIKKNPYIEGNTVNSDFAVRAYEKNLKNLAEPVQKSYNEGLKILKEINSVKTTESLKTLFEKNPEAAKEVCTALGKTPEEFLASVTEKNLSKNKNVIAEKLKSANSTRFQDMKNQILNCWDANANKFVKPESMDENLYNSIKKATTGMKAKIIAKRIAIGGAIAGTIAFIAHKIYTYKKEISNKQY